MSRQRERVRKVRLQKETIRKLDLRPLTPGHLEVVAGGGLGLPGGGKSRCGCPTVNG